LATKRDWSSPRLVGEVIAERPRWSLRDHRGMACVSKRRLVWLQHGCDG
jgi:hypothetical protein